MNEWSYQAHLQGKKHQKKTTETKVEVETRACDLCKAPAIPVDRYQDHLKGKKHLTNLTRLSKPAEPKDKVCAVCNLKDLTQSMLQAHLKGQDMRRHWRLKLKWCWLLASYVVCPTFLLLTMRTISRERSI